MAHAGANVSRLFDSKFFGDSLNNSGEKLPDCISLHGEQIHRFKHIPENILNQNIQLFAPPKSGKTTWLRSMLMAVRPYRPMVLLIAPTNTLGNDFIDDFMHIEPVKKFNAQVQEILDFQKIVTKLHDRANGLTELSAIVDKIGINAALKSRIGELNAMYATGRCNDNYNSCLVKILKSYLSRIPELQYGKVLSKDECKVMKFLTRTPYLVLIFDDMGMSLRDCDAFNSINTRYRHLHITLVTLTHYGSMLSPIARGCGEYKIARYASDLIWLIDNSRGCTNENTENFIKKHGDQIARMSKTNRYFIVLCSCMRGERLQIMFTAAECKPQKLYYKCSNRDLALSLRSKGISITDRCFYIYQAIHEGIISI